MKRAIIYMRRNNYFIHASSKTTVGVWILEEPVFNLPIDISATEIGEKVMEALNNSKENISHPTSWNTLFNPVLNEAGVKSYKTFIKNTVSVEVETEKKQVILIPTKNLGNQEGFKPIEDKKVIILDSNSKQIGEQIIKTFKVAE